MNPIVFIVVSVVVMIIGLPLLAIATYFVWVSWQTRSRRPKENGYKYVYVEENGSAREVTADEKKYLETEFHPADGARPYIKLRYEVRDRRIGIAGYLPRRQLPKNTPITQAPSTSTLPIDKMNE